MVKEPKIEKIPQDESSRTKELVWRFENPEQRGTLTEGEFLKAVGELIEKKGFASKEGKQRAFARFRESYDNARKKQLAKEWAQRAAKPATAAKMEEKHELIPQAEIMSWEELQETYKDRIPPEQWDTVAKAKGALEKAEEFESVTDPQQLIPDSRVKVRVSDTGEWVGGIFKKRLENKFIIRLNNGADIDVTIDDIKAHKPIEIDTEELVALLPEPEHEQVKPVEAQAPSFFPNERVVATKVNPDGSLSIVRGIVMVAGLHNPDNPDGGPCVLIFSTSSKNGKEEYIFADQSSVKLEPGELEAREIKQKTGFSPKEVVRIGDRPELYRVTGFDAKTEKLELVPNDLLFDEEIKQILKRIVTIQRENRLGSEDELLGLQKEIQRISTERTIWEDRGSVHRAPSILGQMPPSKK